MQVDSSAADQNAVREIDELELFGDNEASKVADQIPAKPHDAMEVDQIQKPDTNAAATVSFEELLLMRLTFELTASGGGKMRSQYFLDKLEEIIPEFDDYKKITHALINMNEPDLPVIDHKEERIRPYPSG